MKRNNFIFTILVFLGFTVSCFMAVAQTPVVNVDPQRHGNLAAAQQSIVQAYASISDAQRTNDDSLGGHAGKAKNLLSQANEELRLAANFADSNTSGSGPASSARIVTQAPAADSVTGNQAIPNLSGNWTIYAYNTNKPGSSLKQIQLTQTGNIISGTFHGPNQRGKLQGWISGNHVEFSTDTREVLTFRGEITSTGMSGIYGIQGRHAPWRAERTK